MNHPPEKVLDVVNDILVEADSMLQKARGFSRPNGSTPPPESVNHQVMLAHEKVLKALSYTMRYYRENPESRET